MTQSTELIFCGSEYNKQKKNKCVRLIVTESICAVAQWLLSKHFFFFLFDQQYLKAEIVSADKPSIKCGTHVAAIGSMFD